MEAKKIEVKLNIGAILFIVFLVLKLTNVIEWSWWWVTSPLWISLIIGTIVAIIKTIIKD